MPLLGSLNLSICTEGISPATPDDPFQVVGDKPGMAEQSALFFAPKWRPQRVIYFHGTANEKAATDLIEKARALRRQILDVSDGQTTFKSALVLGCTGTWRNASQVIGPGLTGCTHEVMIVAFILPAAT
jgi:enhancing lycopene biosynthesis protein 2